MKVIVVCVLASLALSYGAVLPAEDDAIFDMVQSFLAQPDEFASAIGMTRVKRSSYDKEFNMRALGIEVGIKYIDPNNKLKGGKADISIDNLKRIVPRAKSTQVKLTVNFNSGSSPRDGLFDMSIDYELHHANVEKGTFTFNRVKDGNMWKTKMNVVSKNNPAVNLIPVFAITENTDRKTMLQGTYSCQHGNDYTINVDRVPGKKIDAIIEGNGKSYILNGVLNKAEKNVKINIDADGLNYEITLDYDDSAEKHTLSADVNLGGSGNYKVIAEFNKDKSGGAFKVIFNDREIVNAKLIGKLKMANNKVAKMKYEVRYSAIGFGEGKLRLAFEGGDKMSLKAQYLPKTGLDLKLNVDREKKADNSRHVHATISRGGENYLEYEGDVVPTVSSSAYELQYDSTFNVNEKSKLYPVFCTYGCFNNRKAHAKLYVEKATPYKFSFDIELTKDGQKVLNLEVNSRNNPYVFKIVAPRILPKILPTGRKSIEFEFDHKPQEYLRVKSNTNAISSFKVEKVAGGQRRIELNGKEIVTAGVSKGDRSISQTVTLPDGRSMTTTISWEKDGMKANKVKINVEGTTRSMDGEMEWDITNMSNMFFNMDVKGQNPRMGNYEMTREIKAQKGANTLNFELKGMSSFPNAPWPNPVKTHLAGDFDYSSNVYNLELHKTMAGRTVGFSFKDGSFSLDMN